MLLRSRTSRSGRPVSGAPLAQQTIADGLDGAADADEQRVGREQHRAEPGDDDEPGDAEERGLREAAVDGRAEQDRRQREHGQEQDARGLEQGEGGEARDRGRGVRRRTG